MRLKIRTNHNVEIEFETAGVGLRLRAALIDWAIIIGYMFGVGYVLIETQYLLNTPVIYMLYVMPPFFYHLAFEIFMHGQSPGKRFMKIKVAKLDGSKPTIGDYILRWLMIPVDQISGVGFVVMAVSQYQQRVGDILAGTTVIRLTSKTRLDDTIFGNLPENYEPVFMNALLLNDRDAQIIRDILNATGQNELNEEKISILNKGRKKIESRLETQSTLADRDYLSRVLKDYYYLSSRLN